MASVLSRMISVAALAVGLAGVVSPPRPALLPERPAVQHPAGYRKAKPNPGGAAQRRTGAGRKGNSAAEEYLSRRNMHPGRSSTLKKAARARRIAAQTFMGW